MENTRAQVATVSSPWLTTKQAADYAQVNARTISDASRRIDPSTGEPELQSTKIGNAKNSAKRYRADWIDRWLERRSVGGEN